MTFKQYALERLKALAAGIGALVTLVIAQLLLAPGAEDTITGWIPAQFDWVRPVIPVLFALGTGWAVERTRNRPPIAPQRSGVINRDASPL